MALLRILVVDDNHLVRRLVSLMLEDAGHVCLEAESGEVALALAHADPPDLLLVDDAMPGMRGAEVVTALRRSPDLRLASLPVVGISGRPAARVELFAAGADVFVPKPIEEGALLAGIRAALHAPRPGGAAPPGQPSA
ncbi:MULTISPECIES: response regulator [Anaeromyxobacter]|uniref:response regulator n=1 Tax=Anaeromyxobacter TaxID=161492 RepID=UPI001F5687DE|nr:MULTISPECIES: response regulator [unclassified Anaeromyxobacter]